METLNGYIAKVQAEADDTSTAAQTVIAQAVKETYQEIGRECFRYLVAPETQDISVTAGDTEKTPNDFTELYGVYYSTGGNFTELKEGATYDPNAVQGTPYRYRLEGGNIVFDRPADAGTLRVLYQPATAELTGNSVIPDRYTRAVVLGACYRFFGYEKGPETENYKQWYLEAKRDMVLELATRNKPVRPSLY